MPAPILYYITDRRAFSGDERSRQQRLLGKIEEASRAGVDYIQLREKDLSARDLEALAREALSVLRKANLQNATPERSSALLINSRTDVALAIGADGVHLPASDLDAEEVRRVWNLSDAGVPRRTKISVSCHGVEEVKQAAAKGVDLAIFAPVFEKKDAAEARPAGLDAL